MAREKGYTLKQVSRVLDNLYPMTSNELKYELIKQLRNVRSVAQSSTNPIDTIMLNILLDILDLDLDQIIPGDN